MKHAFLFALILVATYAAYQITPKRGRKAAFRFLKRHALWVVLILAFVATGLVLANRTYSIPLL